MLRGFKSASSKGYSCLALPQELLPVLVLCLHAHNTSSVGLSSSKCACVSAGLLVVNLWVPKDCHCQRLQSLLCSISLEVVWTLLIDLILHPVYQVSFRSSELSVPFLVKWIGSVVLDSVLKVLFCYDSPLKLLKTVQSNYWKAFWFPSRYTWYFPRLSHSIHFWKSPQSYWQSSCSSSQYLQSL